MRQCLPHTRDMKRILPIIVIALAVSSLASADNLRNKIESMNRKIHNAFMKKDINAFEQITRKGITSDFKYVENGTPESYDEMVAQMKQSFNMMQKVTAANSRILKLSIHGDTADCSTTHHMMAIVGGQDKKTHKMSFDGVSNDSYRKEDGKWKLASMVWGKQKMTMDGKPFDPMKAGG